MLYNLFRMKLKKGISILVLIAISLVWSGITKAQTVKERIISNIEAQRVAFFTERMKLTPAQAQKFWPIYNEYNFKRTKLTAEEARLVTYFKENSATMSENDIDATIKKIIQTRKAITLLFENYNQRFRQILPADKVMKLILAEVEFRSVLLQKIK